MNLSDAELALIGTLFGSAGLKITEYFLGRRDKVADHGSQIREELRKQVLDLRESLASAREIETRLEGEIEEWRSKYYDERDKTVKTETDLMIANSRIEALQADLATTKERIVALEEILKGDKP